MQSGNQVTTCEKILGLSSKWGPASFPGLLDCHFMGKKKIVSQKMYQRMDAEHNRGQLLCVLAWRAIINMVQNDDKKSLLIFCKLKHWGKGVDYTVLNVTEMPTHHHTAFMSHKLTLIRTWLCAQHIMVPFPQVKSNLLLPMAHCYSSTRALPLCFARRTANAVTPQTDVANMIKNINSTIKSA